MGHGGRFLNNNGFTLIELMVSVGLMSVVVLAMADMMNMSARSSQSSAAADQFTSQMSLLVNLMNATTQADMNYASGCTNAFVNGAAAFPFTVFNASNLPTAGKIISQQFNPIYQHYNDPTTPLFLQMTSGSTASAGPNPTFPPPINNLQIMSIAFTRLVDWNFAGADPTKPGETPSTTAPFLPPTVGLFNLEVKAQKVGTQMMPILTGGNTQYTKDILVTLWLDSSYNVTRCGL
jgi:prepilin-type N-terminal cleavage/methylation domain-containing protein